MIRVETIDHETLTKRYVLGGTEILTTPEQIIVNMIGAGYPITASPTTSYMYHGLPVNEIGNQKVLEVGVALSQFMPTYATGKPQDKPVVVGLEDYSEIRQLSKKVQEDPTSSDMVKKIAELYEARAKIMESNLVVYFQGQFDSVFPELLRMQKFDYVIAIDSILLWSAGMYVEYTYKLKELLSPNGTLIT